MDDQSDVTAFFSWLAGERTGPASVFLPTDWAATELWRSAAKWLRTRLRADDAGRFVTAILQNSDPVTDADLQRLRTLLDDPSTWIAAVRDDVEALVTRVQECLEPDGVVMQDGQRRTAEAIVRGILERYLADADPHRFEQIMLRRIERLAQGRLHVIEQALLVLNDDLVTRLDLLSHQTAALADHVDLVLAHAPPLAGLRVALRRYLVALLATVDQPAWPYSAVGIEVSASEAEVPMSARVFGSGPLTTVAVDDLAARACVLVLRAPPGAGKSWLARRIARSAAMRALQALDAGTPLVEIEIPLFTTCRDYFSIPGGARHAAITASLGSVFDFGSDPSYRALLSYLSERRSGVVLILDALDQSPDRPAQRLRAAARIDGWRFVLTSRPSAWRDQFDVYDNKAGRYLADVLPLDEDEGDVRLAVARLPVSQERKARLSAEIEARPRLADLARTPLLLALLATTDLEGSFPDTRAELFDRMLRRILGGRWIDGAPELDDLTRLEDVLEEWAWRAAANDPASGIGAWLDEWYSSGPVDLGDDERRSIDSIAPFARSRGDHERQAPRRFIHRAVHEHLVARRISKLPVDDAAEVLSGHLWFDQDWSYAGPAGLAGHPERDEVLDALVSHILAPTQPGARVQVEDLAPVDVALEVSAFICRAAAETVPDQWRHRALIDAVRSAYSRRRPWDQLAGPQLSAWQASNEDVRQTLLEALVDRRDDVDAAVARNLLGLSHDRATRRHVASAVLDRVRAGKLVSKERLELLDQALEPSERSEAAIALLAARSSDAYRGQRYVLAEVAVLLTRDVIADAYLDDAFLAAVLEGDEWMSAAAAYGLVRTMNPASRSAAQTSIEGRLAACATGGTAGRLARAFAALATPPSRDEAAGRLAAILHGGPPERVGSDIVHTLGTEFPDWTGLLAALEHVMDVRFPTAVRLAAAAILVRHDPSSAVAHAARSTIEELLVHEQDARVMSRSALRLERELSEPSRARLRARVDALMREDGPVAGWTVERLASLQIALNDGDEGRIETASERVVAVLIDTAIGTNGDTLRDELASFHSEFAHDGLLARDTSMPYLATAVESLAARVAATRRERLVRPLFDAEVHRAVWPEVTDSLATNETPDAVFRAIRALAADLPHHDEAIRRLWDERPVHACSPHYTVALAKTVAMLAPRVAAAGRTDALLSLLTDGAADPVTIVKAAKALRELSPERGVAEMVAGRLLDALATSQSRAASLEAPAWPVTAPMLVARPRWWKRLEQRNVHALLRTARHYTSTSEWIANVGRVC